MGLVSSPRTSIALPCQTCWNWTRKKLVPEPFAAKVGFRCLMFSGWQMQLTFSSWRLGWQTFTLSLRTATDRGRQHASTCHHKAAAGCISVKIQEGKWRFHIREKTSSWPYSDCFGCDNAVGSWKGSLAGVKNATLTCVFRKARQIRPNEILKENPLVGKMKMLLCEWGALSRCHFYLAQRWNNKKKNILLCHITETSELILYSDFR